MAKIMLRVKTNRKTRPGAVGRPRAFDTAQALDRALEVFWRKGYEGTAMSDLTAAMRINRPSIYSAFGNKEQLFRKVLDRYSDGPASYVRKALDEPTARRVVERLLCGAAGLEGNQRNPPGCLIVQGALACGDAAESVRRELMSRRAFGEAALRKRLIRAKLEGDLPRDSNPTELAQYVVTVLHGMAVEAASGASPRKLRGVAELALRVWPN
jgi:AcrR family transcriptional regulator